MNKSCDIVLLAKAAEEARNLWKKINDGQVNDILAALVAPWIDTILNTLVENLQEGVDMYQGFITVLGDVIRSLNPEALQLYIYSKQCKATVILAKRERSIMKEILGILKKYDNEYKRNVPDDELILKKTNRIRSQLWRIIDSMKKSENCTVSNLEAGKVLSESIYNLLSRIDTPSDEAGAEILKMMKKAVGDEQKTDPTKKLKWHERINKGIESDIQGLKEEYSIRLTLEDKIKELDLYGDILKIASKYIGTNTFAPEISSAKNAMVTAHETTPDESIIGSSEIFILVENELKKIRADLLIPGSKTFTSRNFYTLEEQKANLMNGDDNKWTFLIPNADGLNITGTSSKTKMFLYSIRSATPGIAGISSSDKEKIIQAKIKEEVYFDGISDNYPKYAFYQTGEAIKEINEHSRLSYGDTFTSFNELYIKYHDQLLNATGTDEFVAMVKEKESDIAGLKSIDIITHYKTLLTSLIELILSPVSSSMINGLVEDIESQIETLTKTIVTLEPLSNYENVFVQNNLDLVNDIFPDMIDNISISDNIGNALSYGSMFLSLSTLISECMDKPIPELNSEDKKEAISNYKKTIAIVSKYQQDFRAKIDTAIDKMLTPLGWGLEALHGIQQSRAELKEQAQAGQEWMAMMTSMRATYQKMKARAEIIEKMRG